MEQREWEAYDKFTDRVAIYPEAGTGSETELMYLGLALGNEVGELLGSLKKIVRDPGNPRTSKYRRDAVLEMGDVLFYYRRLLKALQTDDKAVAAQNIRKIEEREASGTMLHHE